MGDSVGGLQLSPPCDTWMGDAQQTLVSSPWEEVGGVREREGPKGAEEACPDDLGFALAGPTKDSRPQGPPSPCVPT